MKSLYMQRQTGQDHSEEGGNKVDNEVAALKMSEELFAYLDRNQIGRIPITSIINLFLSLQICKRPSFIKRLIGLALRKKLDYFIFDDFFTLF
jgi:hypothetical protein